MNKLAFITLVLLTIISCNQQTSTTIKLDNAALNKMFDNYYEDRMKLYPIEATQNGDNRYNDQLPIYIAESFKDKLHNFYTKYLNEVEKYDTSTLDENDLIGYKIFDREMKMQLEALDLNILYPAEMACLYIPFQQFWGLPITMGQLGSGEGIQPFQHRKRL